MNEEKKYIPKKFHESIRLASDYVKQNRYVDALKCYLDAMKMSEEMARQIPAMKNDCEGIRRAMSSMCEIISEKMEELPESELEKLSEIRESKDGKLYLSPKPEEK